MDEEMIINLIDNELINLNKLIYTMKGEYEVGDPQMYYFKMRQRLEMLEATADWSRIIQSRLDLGDNEDDIVNDFINFVTVKYADVSLMWFYRHLEVESRLVIDKIFRAAREQLLLKK